MTRNLHATIPTPVPGILEANGYGYFSIYIERATMRIFSFTLFILHLFLSLPIYIYISTCIYIIKEERAYISSLSSYIQRERKRNLIMDKLRICSCIYNIIYIYIYVCTAPVHIHAR